MLKPPRSAPVRGTREGGLRRSVTMQSTQKKPLFAVLHCVSTLRNGSQSVVSRPAQSRSAARCGAVKPGGRHAIVKATNSAHFFFVCMIFMPPHAIQAMHTSTVSRSPSTAAFAVLSGPTTSLQLRATKRWPLERSECRRRAWNAFTLRPRMSGGGDFSDVKIRTPKQGADIYKAKQSLGQNFLVDQNVARKIVDQLQDESEQGSSVVEVGPGKGALTGMLLQRYPQMRAVEIDQRSVEYLSDVLPSLNVMHQDVLEVEWSAISKDVNSERLSVIGNLPYYITSQILFSLIDASPLIKRAVITLQLEVAERICSPPGNKAYGILSVVSQLYGTPKLAFKIPSTAFQPKPDVTSALVVVDFPPHRPELDINECHMRTVLRAAFQQRRKMLRQSLKALLKEKDVTLPDEWGTKRPEVLSPREFVELTKMIFGPGETPEGVAVWRGKLDDVARL